MRNAHGRVPRYEHPALCLCDRYQGRHRKARYIADSLIADLIERDRFISAQVLSEFSANAMRKGNPPLTPNQTSRLVETFSEQTVIPIDASLVQLAVERVQQSRLSYWDALIVEAAIRSGATTLYTEDMHHGTHYGGLELRNPFL